MPHEMMQGLENGTSRLAWLGMGAGPRQPRINHCPTWSGGGSFLPPEPGGDGAQTPAGSPQDRGRPRQAQRARLARVQNEAGSKAEPFLGLSAGKEANFDPVSTQPHP